MIFPSLLIPIIINNYKYESSHKLIHKMKRYFYTGNKLTKAWLDSQYNMIRMQDDIYRNALLAALKLEPEKVKTFKSLRQTILNMTIQQQARYASNYHIEALFKHFDSLHRNSRGRKMMVRGKQSLSKDIVDPDKFPIWDLKKKPNIFYSIWNTIMGKVRYDIGHQLVVRNSLIQHPQGGRGVFVSLSSHKKQIQIGDFLGLVPGIIYDSYESYKRIKLETKKSYQKTPQHLHFPSGKVLQLGEITQYDDITKTDVNLQPYLINPYSLGQFVNHPPYGQKPNVIFTEIQWHQSFFPKYLQKYLPYNAYLPIQTRKKNTKARAYGIFAKQPIKNNQQLYVDYCENHIYPIENIPQWMIQPDYKAEEDENAQPNPYNLNFSKEQYQNPSPQYWRLIQNQALEKNRELYEKYLKIVKYRPNKVLYQDEGVKISNMSLKQPKRAQNKQ